MIARRPADISGVPGEMKAAEYRVFPFPERGYTLDAVVQEQLTTRSVRGGRTRVFLFFFGFFESFVAGVLGPARIPPSRGRRHPAGLPAAGDGAPSPANSLLPLLLLPPSD